MPIIYICLRKSPVGVLFWGIYLILSCMTPHIDFYPERLHLIVTRINRLSMGVWFSSAAMVMTSTIRAYRSTAHHQSKFLIFRYSGRMPRRDGLILPCMSNSYWSVNVFSTVAMYYRATTSEWARLKLSFISSLLSSFNVSYWLNVNMDERGSWGCDWGLRQVLRDWREACEIFISFQSLCLIWAYQNRRRNMVHCRSRLCDLKCTKKLHLIVMIRLLPLIERKSQYSEWTTRFERGLTHFIQQAMEKEVSVKNDWNSTFHYVWWRWWASNGRVDDVPWNVLLVSLSNRRTSRVFVLVPVAIEENTSLDRRTAKASLSDLP